MGVRRLDPGAHLCVRAVATFSVIVGGAHGWDSPFFRLPIKAKYARMRSRSRSWCVFHGAVLGMGMRCRDKALYATHHFLTFLWAGSAYIKLEQTVERTRQLDSLWALGLDMRWTFLKFFVWTAYPINSEATFDFFRNLFNCWLNKCATSMILNLFKSISGLLIHWYLYDWISFQLNGQDNKLFKIVLKYNKEC